MSIEEIKKENEEEQISKENQNDEANEKNNEVYFLILIPSEEKLDFQGKDYDTKNMINPSIIYKNKVETGDETYLEEIIFKATKKKKKKGKDNESSKSTKYSITFFEEEHMYNITFSAKNECFIYQPKLERGNKFLQDIFLLNQFHRIVFHFILSKIYSLKL